MYPFPGRVLPMFPSPVDLQYINKLTIQKSNLPFREIYHSFVWKYTNSLVVNGFGPEAEASLVEKKMVKKTNQTNSEA